MSSEFGLSGKLTLPPIRVIQELPANQYHYHGAEAHSSSNLPVPGHPLATQVSPVPCALPYFASNTPPRSVSPPDIQLPYQSGANFGLPEPLRYAPQYMSPRPPIYNYEPPVAQRSYGSSLAAVTYSKAIPARPLNNYDRKNGRITKQRTKPENPATRKHNMAEKNRRKAIRSQMGHQRGLVPGAAAQKDSKVDFSKEEPTFEISKEEFLERETRVIYGMEVSLIAHETALHDLIRDAEAGRTIDITRIKMCRDDVRDAKKKYVAFCEKYSRQDCADNEDNDKNLSFMANFDHGLFNSKWRNSPRSKDQLYEFF